MDQSLNQKLRKELVKIQSNNTAGKSKKATKAGKKPTLNQTQNKTIKKHRAKKLVYIVPADVQDRAPINTKEVDLVINEPINGLHPNMPGLKSITINYFDLAWRKWFGYQNFKNIEKLHVDCSLETEDFWDDLGDFRMTASGWKVVIQNNLEAMFTGMENLKHLYLHSTVARFWDQIEGPSKLESADVNCYYPFIKASSKTLKDLKLITSDSAWDGDNLYEIFDGYRKLEKFSALMTLNDDDFKYSLKNKNRLKCLDIHFKGDNYMKCLMFILAATPSLEELTIYSELSSDMVQHLARTLKKLKKVTARGGISTYALDTLDCLKGAKRKKLNTDFEIIWEENRPWKREFLDIDTVLTDEEEEEEGEEMGR